MCQAPCGIDAIGIPILQMRIINSERLRNILKVTQLESGQPDMDIQSQHCKLLG